MKIGGRQDLNSIEEAVDFHNLSQESNLFYSKDPDTINIAKNILGKNYNIFQIDNIKIKNSNILFTNIQNSPFLKDYQKNKKLNIMIAAGGPAAEEQIIIASSDKNIKAKFDDIIYINRNYLESNSHHSTKQIHSRNSSALYANDYFAGHILLFHSLLQKIFPKKYKVFDINYPKINIKFSLNSELLKIYLKNEINWLWQKCKKILGKKTIYDQDSINAKDSIKIQQDLERRNKINLRNDNLPAIEIVLKNQKRCNLLVSDRRLQRDKIDNIFGQKNLIKDVVLFPQDGCLKYDIHQINSQIAKENGAKWLDSVEISQILIDNSTGEDRLAGIITEDKKYIYCSKLHLSLGYKAKYQFAKDLNFNIKISDNIVATGISMVVIFKNSSKLKNLLNISSAILMNDIYISLIAKNDDYILFKIASGANIDSDKYRNSYFFNILYHLRLIFNDDLIGILSCYACCRSINGQNSTRFTKIGKDIVISDGKGGSGNSKRYFEGMFALNNAI